MVIKDVIFKLRTSHKMSQEVFATLLNVSRQTVQKWEGGVSVPELSKLVEMSNLFDVSLDALILGFDSRAVEELEYNKTMKPQYSNVPNWEFYAHDILVEYWQSVDEGLDINAYKDLFEAVSILPRDEIKNSFADILFDVVIKAPRRAGYKYIEPSDLKEIKTLRREHPITGKVDKKVLASKIHGAWMGRVCGCMLGKTVEGIRTDELVPFLQKSNNYPMHRYIFRTDIKDDVVNRYNYTFANRVYADEIDGMPVDDDTNYVVLAQSIIEEYGKDFTPYDVSRAWLKYQSKDSYCTAERVAYCNFVKGFEPPYSATHKNPYREFIGAQIRGDYFGYINPGNPELAAEMAWRDASISHVKNGIYGEMFVAAMIAIAAVNNNVEDIILGGLAQIPSTSRLYESILSILDDFKSGVSKEACFDRIHNEYDEYTSYGWCHTISNAMVVVASLLYGEGDYGKSICMSVETGFDTDCNGATVGSILGMANGIESIPECWTKPIKDTLHTSIFGVGTVKISDRVKMTMNHLFKTIFNDE